MMVITMAKKNTSPAAPSGKEIKSLRKELAALQKQVSKLQTQLAKVQQPTKLRAGKLTVQSLEVVDGNGKVVASIDAKGNLFCLTAWASTGKNVRGVFIDGRAERKVSAGSLELIEPVGNNPGVIGVSRPFGAALYIRNPQTKQQLTLQGSGAPIIAFDEQGAGAAMIEVNSPAGGILTLKGTKAGSKALAKVSVSHLTNAGAVYLADANGNKVAGLP